MIVLGLETSCDETAVALYAVERGLLAHRLYSQVAVHAEFGGVVPELAARDHIRKLAPLTAEILREQGLTVPDLGGVAYTAGPGLVGALMVGACFGRSLAWSAGMPAVAVHHMEAHLLAPMLTADPPHFPFLALLISGGHTLLVSVAGIGCYEVLGESLDDAAGEAFDKTAKLLGLAYPGGPELERLALSGDAQRFHFPRPMTDRPGLDFSFSGLKTYAANIIRDHRDDPTARADIAAAFTAAIVDTFVLKTRRAIDATRLDTLVVAGGVSANRSLRAGLDALAAACGIRVCYPDFEFCTDNAAMVAYAGCQRLAAGQHDNLSVDVRSRWSLNDLTPVPSEM